MILPEVGSDADIPAASLDENVIYNTMLCVATDRYLVQTSSQKD